MGPSALDALRQRVLREGLDRSAQRRDHDRRRRTSSTGSSIRSAIKASSAAILRWTGIDITSGLEFTRWSLVANDTITNDYTVQAGTGSTDLSVASTGTFDLKSNALTVPIELTTGFRMVELVSLYFGVGFDFTEGKADLDANLTGTMKTPDGTNVGTVTITGTGSNTASPGNFYGLAGVQLNLWALKIFSQVNLSPEPAASLAFGLRLVL